MEPAQPLRRSTRARVSQPNNTPQTLAVVKLPLHLPPTPNAPAVKAWLYHVARLASQPMHFTCYGSSSSGYLLWGDFQDGAFENALPITSIGWLHDRIEWQGEFAANPQKRSREELCALYMRTQKVEVQKTYVKGKSASKSSGPADMTLEREPFFKGMNKPARTLWGYDVDAGGLVSKAWVGDSSFLSTMK